MKRELVAILFADVVGYSRLAGLDEEQTHRRLDAGLDLLTAKIQAFGGEKVNEAGDAILAEFHSVIDSVNCAVDFQMEMATINGMQSEADKLEFRVGVNLGEVIYNRGDIYGDGVNVAARIQEIAEPGGVCISSAVYEQVHGKVDHTFDDLGHRKAKNISRTLHIYRIHLSDSSPGIESQPLFDFDSSARDKSSLTTGGCMCGSVRYEISQPAMGTGFCHCRMCQRASGEPVNAWAAFPVEAVRFFKKKPKIYKSSPIAERGFCANCGTGISYRLLKPEPAEFVVLNTISLDNPEDFAPTWHAGVESQMPWLDIHDDLPRTLCTESPSLRKAWESVGIVDTADWKP